MENRIAIIKDNKIHQIILASDEHAATLSEHTINVTDIDAAIGWEYDGTNITAPTDDWGVIDREGEELRAARLEWRNHELKLTDSMVPITDHPDHAAVLEYRQLLRDWPSTSDFPNTKPNSDNLVFINSHL